MHNEQADGKGTDAAQCEHGIDKSFINSPRRRGSSSIGCLARWTVVQTTPPFSAPRRSPGIATPNDPSDLSSVFQAEMRSDIVHFSASHSSRAQDRRLSPAAVPAEMYEGARRDGDLACAMSPPLGARVLAAPCPSSTAGLESSPLTQLGQAAGYSRRTH